MKIIIAAIGKLNKKSPEQALIDNYISKTRWALLMAQVPAGYKVVALDERGEEPSSRAFAKKIARWRDEGAPGIAFLIGGADGHTDTLRGKADWLLSFGHMTLPHFLARVVLSEQIYRAKTILDGHPYHRD